VIDPGKRKKTADMLGGGPGIFYRQGFELMTYIVCLPVAHAEKLQNIQIPDKPVGIVYQIFPEGIDEPVKMILIPAWRSVTLTEKSLN
jgi:hypothetical protein